MTGLTLELPSVGDMEFRRYQRLLLQHAGMNLGETKKALLAGRLTRRLRELGLNSFGRYFERLRSDPAEQTRMIDLVLTNETSFFREADQFAFLRTTIVPRWIEEAARARRPRKLRIWSAGCATGEEPFSVAMLLRSEMPAWLLDILASDLSTTALLRAEQGVWPITKAAGIPDEFLQRYMLRGVGEQTGMMKIGPELRWLVSFRRVNLNDSREMPSGPFDLLLCRNVLIYFDAEARRQVVERLIELTAPGGYLFVGHAETLKGFARVEPLAATVWRRLP